jgi:SNF2 family DNA or RNA helicase
MIKNLIQIAVSAFPEFEHLVVLDEMLKGCDGYIATGSNNSARYFEHYFSKYPHIIRKNRTSVGVLDGTESAEEKEIIRNIYNGDWDAVPTNISSQLREIANNNNMGEIIKVFMITSSGSEGINLRNTRYVHIMEPYWHPVRVEQVIGRARRICSHKDLPPELQSVEVFIYLMTFTQEQIKSGDSIELKLKDLSKREPKIPLTSDEALYEISSIKEEVNTQLINAIKIINIEQIKEYIKILLEDSVITSFIYGNIDKKEKFKNIIKYKKVLSFDWTNFIEIYNKTLL